LLRAI